MSEKSEKLQAVYDAASALRSSQKTIAPGGRVRETFVDAVFDATKVATQQEIADTINQVDPKTPMSRQRVAQFVEEKKKSLPQT